jgi:hypothetical protein
MVLACGETKRISRRKHKGILEIVNGCGLAGAEFNLAAFLPSRLSSKNMSIGELIYLAAHSIGDLQSAAHQAAHALQAISDVQKVIAIAVAAVGMGAAIVDPTPGTVASSVNALVQAIQQSTVKTVGSGAGSSSTGETGSNKI